MQNEEFEKELNKMGIVLTDHQKKQLDHFYHLLVKWNQIMNLTRIIEREDVYLKHYYDSLTLVKIEDLSQKETLCDIGSGAGFPGIVLKIVFPHLKITLIDSLKKRVDYLTTIIEELKLENIKALHVRAEDYAKTNREVFDIVTARAVSSLENLLNYAIPMTKVNGSFLVMKGKIEEELKDALPLIEKLDCKIEKKLEFYLPKEESLRTLIKITKQKLTKECYPKKNIGKKKNVALKSKKML